MIEFGRGYKNVENTFNEIGSLLACLFTQPTSLYLNTYPINSIDQHIYTIIKSYVAYSRFNQDPNDITLSYLMDEMICTALESVLLDIESYLEGRYEESEEIIDKIMNDTHVNFMDEFSYNSVSAYIIKDLSDETVLFIDRLIKFNLKDYDTNIDKIKADIDRITLRDDSLYDEIAVCRDKYNEMINDWTSKDKIFIEDLDAFYADVEDVLWNMVDIWSGMILYNMVDIIKKEIDQNVRYTK